MAAAIGQVYGGLSLYGSNGIIQEYDTVVSYICLIFNIIYKIQGGNGDECRMWISGIYAAFFAELPVCDWETVIAFKDLHIKK